MEKFLGDMGLERIRDNIGGRLLPKDNGQRLQREITYIDNYGDEATMTVTDYALPIEMLKCPVYNGEPYKMADKYPAQYDVMAEVPDTVGFSSLPIVDGIFKGCAGLTTLPDATFKTGVSAVEFAAGCTYLENASWTVLPASDMERAFYECEHLEAPPEIDWPRVSNAYAAFLGCRTLPAVFPQVVDLSGMSEKNGWKMMFADSSVRKVYVKGYQLGTGAFYCGNELFDAAWVEWNKGNGTENGDNTTVTVVVPAGGMRCFTAGTYTVTAPTALFENYIDYLKDNAARWLANEMCGGDRFRTKTDVDPNSVSNPITDGEKETLLTMTQAEQTIAYNASLLSVKELKSENLGDNETPDWRYWLINIVEGNTYGNPWHALGSTNSGNDYTFTVTHYNDKTLKLAVRLI